MSERKPKVSHITPGVKERTLNELGKAWLPSAEELARLHSVYGENIHLASSEEATHLRSLLPLTKHPFFNEPLMRRLAKENPLAADGFMEQSLQLIEKTEQALDLWRNAGLPCDVFYQD